MDVYPSFELMRAEPFADTLPGECKHIKGPPVSGCGRCPPGYGLSQPLLPALHIVITLPNCIHI
jgi:hypothetical protein